MDQTVGGTAVPAKPCISHVSIWRAREIRRQEAKQRDKSMIRDLQQQLLVLELELQSWWSWYHNHRHQHVEHVGGFEADAACTSGLDCLVPKERGQCRTADPKPSCIDYSRWDHLDECSNSSEEREGEEDEEAKGDGEDEGCTEMYACCLESIGATDTEEEENGQGDEANCVSDLEAEDEEEETGKEAEEDETFRVNDAESFTECCQTNKRVLLGELDRAYADVQSAFEALGPALEENEALSSVAETCFRQLASFKEMLRNIPEHQVSKDGARQIKSLIDQWRDDILANLAARFQGSDIT